ncbi:polysaccharide biosynthesis/export family protein [Polluticoccus soli]|uniref:polysaccharide biosynthesis/export family protein n=1 Tax=Polluticoccus soli TaxID=3034150 RepID=UPI0023E21002|nr:polysaccharide biosynthesis/export family protein [Flavipsychrobacter sp. JY13-12]
MTKSQSVFSKGSFGLVWLLGLFLLLGSGCSSSKQSVYFRDAPSLSGGTVQVVEFSSFKIKPDDILDISIQTLDPQNMQGVSSTGAGSEKVENGAPAGFVVDKNGYIELPIVGRMHVEGLTLSEAKEKIRTQAKQFFKDPLVNIRLANFRVTVLGEVLRPGTIMVPAEKAGLLDVIGMVGDLSSFANREKIVLIREEGTTKKFVELDITSADVFKSPYYYVRPGDVIYAEPTKVRNRNVNYDATRDRYISYLLSAVTVTLTIITFVRYNSKN